MGNKESFPQSGYECLQFLGMNYGKASLTDEEAEKLWDEFDTKKQEVFDRELDADKIDQIFVKIADTFTNQLVESNSDALEEARKKLPSDDARALKKFNKNIEKAKEVINKEVKSKSSIAHFLRAAKLSSSGKISKQHFVATLSEGAEFEQKGLKWLNFNKYTGPHSPPRESKMLRPSTAPDPKLSAEENFRRSKIVIALKPASSPSKERQSVQVKPRPSAQPRRSKEFPQEGKGKLAEHKIEEGEEGQEGDVDKEERINALQAEKDRLAQELNKLKLQVAEQSDNRGVGGETGSTS
jgi:hypothetical protein